MSRITLSQLEAFFWVAELGSVQKAARRLSLAQPTVSLRLRQLESGLAAPVLERHGRGVRLTPAGHAFLARTRLVLDAYGQLSDASLAVPVAGTLRIGLAEGFAVACLSHLIKALGRDYPLLRPEWTVTTSASLEEGLVAGGLDMAVLVDAIGHQKIRLHPLGPQPNVWAASPQLGVGAGASPAALERFTIVTTPPPTSMYRNTAAWFAQGGRMPDALCLCTSVNAAAQLVEAGIGIGIFPAKMVSAYRGGIAVIDADPPPPVGHVYAACRAAADDARVAPIMRAVEDVTRALRYFET